MSILSKPKPKPLSVKIKEAAQLAELDAVERAAQFKREQEEAERNVWRAEQAKAARTETAELTKSARAARLAEMVPYIPLILVNVAAITGQYGWAIDNLTEIGSDTHDPVRWLAAALFAFTAESIALFLQYYANRALRNRDSALTLYLSAFLVAGLVATVNYSHWSTHSSDKDLLGSPTPTAVIFALCSLASPWLWRIHNRAEYREVLKKAGEIDTRAVKLSLARKIMHPYRSFMVIWNSSWKGDQTPAEAVAAWDKIHDERVARKIERKRQARADKAAERAAKAEPVPADQEAVIKPQAPAQRAPKAPAGVGVGPSHPKWAEGVRIYEASKAGPGRSLSQRDLAGHLNMSNRDLATAIKKFVDERDQNAINNVAPSSP